jgi:hypothetical protein
MSYETLTYTLLYVPYEVRTVSYVLCVVCVSRTIMPPLFTGMTGGRLVSDLRLVKGPGPPAACCPFIDAGQIGSETGISSS